MSEAPGAEAAFLADQQPTAQRSLRVASGLGVVALMLVIRWSLRERLGLVPA